MNQWLAEHARPIVDSIVYSVLGAIVLLFGFWLATRFLPFSTKKEIEDDHNVAFAILVASFILGLAVIIASAIH